MSYDFSGYATRNDLKCADGRTIRKDAFKDNDGQVVPLVWQHQHNDPNNVLGHCELENREDGVYAYCSFNDTPSGLNAKKLVAHGDVTSLSIYANHLVENGGSVLHGAIKEVSLVLSGANPGAFIDNIAFAHGDGTYQIASEEAIIYTGESIDLWPDVSHSDCTSDKKDKEEDKEEDKDKELEHSKESSLEENQNESENSDKTIGDIYETFTKEQKDLVDALCLRAMSHSDDDEEESLSHAEGKTVKDVFDEMTEEQRNVAYYLIGMAKQKSEKEDNEMSEENTKLQHADEEAKAETSDEETVGDIVEAMSDAKKKFVEDAIKAAKSGSENVQLDSKVWDSMSEKEKKVAAFLVGSAAKDKGEAKHSDDNEEYFEHADEEVKEETKEEAPKRSNEEIVASLSSDKKAAIEKAINKQISQADFAVVWGKFTQEERDAVMALINKDKNIKHDDLEGGNTTMSYNVFENDRQETNVLSHADTEAIFADAKRFGSLRESFLAHTASYGIDGVDKLFPDAQLVDKNIAIIRNNPTDWVAKVMNGVRKSPFTRIKTMYSDATTADARARGYYAKGNQKNAEVIALLERETYPTTIYKLQKLDRDDILDISDFNVVAWLKAEMKVMLEEEIARAILVGDGRQSGNDRIDPTKIRPIVADVASPVVADSGTTEGADVYGVRHGYSVSGTENEYEKFIDECNLGMIDYQGTGSPTLFTTPTIVANLLILKDGDGRRMYRGRDDLANALGVKEIVEVPFINNTFTKLVSGTSKTFSVTGIVVNLTDYTVGCDKGGEVNMFDDFDIDYNQQKYLIETRISGALTKYHSAIILGKQTN